MEENEKDIIDEEMNRVKDEKAKAEIEAEAKTIREAYIKEQKKKEQLIYLYFPELEKTGTLKILFSPIRDSLRRTFSQDELPPVIDEWMVGFFIGNQPQRFFSEYKDALAYFWELYRKHDLEENRITYIDNEIAKQEDYKERNQKQIRKGIIALGFGIIISGISGIVIAVVSKEFVLGIIIGAFFIALAVICVWNLLINGISDARIHKREIEKLKKDKIKTGF